MIVAVLSALAERTRLEAVRCLADGSEHCVCELMRKLGTTQSRMSWHTQVLKQARLVVDRRDAQWVRYRSNPELPPPIARLIEAALDCDLVAKEAAA